MRGLHSTLAHGASAHVVASSLGHESFSTTIGGQSRFLTLKRLEPESFQTQSQENKT
jgi:hypothetical protein